MRQLLWFVLGAAVMLVGQVLAGDLTLRQNGSDSMVVTTPDGREHLLYMPPTPQNPNPAASHRSPC